jgi:hypothetical protein
MHKENDWTCWSTPLTNACFVVMTSLVHEGSLTITFRADFEEVVSLVSFCFKQASFYRIESSHLAADRTAFTLKQYRHPEPVSEGSLFDLKGLSRFAIAMYEQSQVNSEFDQYVFALPEKTIQVFSTERPDVRVIASQLKLAS